MTPSRWRLRDRSDRSNPGDDGQLDHHRRDPDDDGRGAVPQRQHRDGGVYRAVVLAAIRVADHDEAIRKVPWKPIIMVSGVTVLIGLLEKTGGLDLFTSLLARTATRESLTGMVAFVTGVSSVYSSSSGVVWETRSWLSRSTLRPPPPRFWRPL